MPTTITWLGHATFEIETNGKRLLIDPFLTDNPSASCSADDLNPDVILLTHGHGDHVADAVSIAKRTGALVIANFEICHWLGNQEVQQTHAMHIGGQHAFDFGAVKLTIAHHGSMLPDGSNGGNPCGILLKLADGTIYHAGDTGLFSDMALIGEEGIDLAILPIGDNFTMGPEDSIRAIRMLQPKQVLPCHYDTWPLIAQDAPGWAATVENQTNAKPTVLKPGESVQLGS
jgi:L-ascorbate metabolism protein UlaG (beta-lactamase superfamily)